MGGNLVVDVLARIDWVKILELTFSVLISGGSLLMSTYKIWGPILASRFKDETSKRAFDFVTRAGMLGANEILASVRNKITASRSPTSEGGSVITTTEWTEILVAGVDTAITWLKKQNAMETAVSIYGSEEAVRKSLGAIIERQMEKTATLNQTVPHAPVGAR